jgi:hypothetical protein
MPQEPMHPQTALVVMDVQQMVVAARARNISSVPPETRSLLLKPTLLANTEKSALIRTNEFFGPDLDQRGFTAASCKDPLSFHHFRINQEQRLIPEGGSSSTRIAGFFQDFFWSCQTKSLSLQRFGNP